MRIFMTTDSWSTLASGALMTVTKVGTWMAPASRVTWVPPHFTHSRRSYGETDVRVRSVPPSLNAQLPEQPSVFTITPLSREACVALFETEGEGAASSAGELALGRHRRRAPPLLPKSRCGCQSQATIG